MSSFLAVRELMTALLSNIELLSYRDKIDRLLFPGVFSAMNDRELLSDTVVFILMNTRTGKTVTPKAETGDGVGPSSQMASQSGRSNREDGRGRPSTQSGDKTGGQQDEIQEIQDPNDRVIEGGSCCARRASDNSRNRVKRFIHKTGGSFKRAFKKRQPSQQDETEMAE